MVSVVKRCLNTIKSFDMLGTPFGLNYKDSTHYNTILGGVSSCCILLFVFIGFSLLFYQFIDRTSPDVTITESYTPQFPEFDLYTEFYNPMILLSRAGSPIDEETEPLPTYITAFASIIQIDTEIDPATQKPKNTVKSTIVPFVRCSKVDPHLKTAYLNEELISQWYDIYGYCLDIKDPSIYKVNGKAS